VICWGADWPFICGAWTSRAGEFPPEAVWTSGLLPWSLELPLWFASGAPPILFTFLDARRVGRSVHLRFLCAHRLHGNFLSHLVLVFAQLLQAMGVRPADFGIMP
jgi:hypothetical protein